MDLAIAILDLILMPLVYFGFFGYLVYRYKMKPKSVEFRLFLFIILTLIISVSDIIIVIGIFDNNLIAAGIFYPIGMIGIFITVPYGIRTIQNQAKTIKNRTENLMALLSAGSGASINIANNTTELSASAHEVNSSAEEISTTTYEVAKRIKKQNHCHSNRQ